MRTYVRTRRGERKGKEGRVARRRGRGREMQYGVRKIGPRCAGTRCARTMCMYMRRGTAECELVQFALDSTVRAVCGGDAKAGNEGEEGGERGRGTRTGSAREVGRRLSTLRRSTAGWGIPRRPKLTRRAHVAVYHGTVHRTHCNVGFSVGKETMSSSESARRGGTRTWCPRTACDVGSSVRGKGRRGLEVDYRLLEDGHFDDDLPSAVRARGVADAPELVRAELVEDVVGAARVVVATNPRQRSATNIFTASASRQQFAWLEPDGLRK
ncbi:hypothetical protein B0H16DRAFT_1826284 [Mycena metata]|uniref:Uncharacterized protein n=1 Tax=Mycena metata TaxID=1033252 RepID=A0AAD7M8I8_9AGAR|nr:hypothetical protein B0H16DRAFT_1826284 [Mycena metata]